MPDAVARELGFSPFVVPIRGILLVALARRVARGASGRAPGGDPLVRAGASLGVGP